MDMKIEKKNGFSLYLPPTCLFVGGLSQSGQALNANYFLKYKQYTPGRIPYKFQGRGPLLLDVVTRQSNPSWILGTNIVFC